MLGVLFVAIGSLFDEISTSLGKHEVQVKKETIYTMGFLSMFWGFVFFVIITAIRNSFVFKTASLSFLIPRLILDIVQNHALMVAAVKADRSTFGFLRVITIPLLLLVDVGLGYSINSAEFLGIIVILCTLVFLFLLHGVRTKGMGIVLFTGVNSVITLTLYKYNITHYNSVEAENLIGMGVIMVYFYIAARIIGKENPLRLIAKPVLFYQSFTEGFPQVFESFAYSFAPASVIATSVRAFGVAWSVVSGRFYFHEKHMLVKSLLLVFLVFGLILLAF